MASLVPRFPPFLCSSFSIIPASVDYTESKTKSKKRGRPGNEAITRPHFPRLEEAEVTKLGKMEGTEQSLDKQ